MGSADFPCMDAQAEAPHRDGSAGVPHTATPRFAQRKVSLRQVLRQMGSTEMTHVAILDQKRASILTLTKKYDMRFFFLILVISQWYLYVDNSTVINVSYLIAGGVAQR